MSKGNSTMGWVLGLGALAVAGIAYFKNKGGTTASNEVPFDVTDLSISLADFGNLKFLDETLPPYMSYDLVVNVTNKGGKGVSCKKFTLEITDGTKQITTLEVVDKNGADVAFFSPKATSQATVGVQSEMWRTFELLGMTYAKFTDKINKHEVAYANPTIVKWLFDNTTNFRTQRHLWDDVKASFTNAFKFGKTLTIKCTAHLDNGNGIPFSVSTTNQFTI